MTVQGSNVFPIGIKKRSGFAQAAVQQPSEEARGRPIGNLLFEFHAGKTDIDCDVSEEQIPAAIAALEHMLGKLRGQHSGNPYKLVST